MRVRMDAAENQRVTGRGLGEGVAVVRVLKIRPTLQQPLETTLPEIRAEGNPNCEADEDEGRVFIKALRNIKAGEELNYDYGLIIDERYTPKLKAEYPCWCGAKNCRGTLLAPKRRK